MDGKVFSETMLNSANRHLFEQFKLSALSYAAVIRGFFNNSRFNMLCVAFVVIRGRPAAFLRPRSTSGGNLRQHGEVSLQLILIVENADKFL